MRELHKDPNAIISTPVFLDATCSGIQHFAALLQDQELATQVNLTPSTGKDLPARPYGSPWGGGGHKLPNSGRTVPINKPENKFRVGGG